MSEAKRATYPGVSEPFLNFSTNMTSSLPPTQVSNQTEWNRAFSSTIAAILIVASLVAIVGNLMVLAVIIRHRGMRTRTNLFLVNLAVADLLVGILLMPFSITTMISHGWRFGNDSFCTFNGWMNSFCLITSIHTLMYIGIHKYFSIVHPLSKAFHLRTILLMMAMAWLWAGICSTLNVVGLKIVYKPGTSQCGPNYPDGVTMYIIHVILQLTVMIIPFFILVFCYTRMFIEIKKHSARLRKNSTVEEEYILATQKKVAMTLFIVLATFFMMALPYVSYATYTTIRKEKQFMAELNPVAYMFLYLNSMVNPIIYAFRSPAFREGYKEILCQTPNYVISDDSEPVPRTSRLASLVMNMRRNSNNSAYCLDAVLAGTESTQDLSAPELKRTSKIAPVPTTPTALSPSEVLANKRAKLTKTRRKSLFDLLRATRQSNAQSVVHRNGDMIIMKGGKIVSVHRREQPKESNALLDRLTKLAQNACASGNLAVPGAEGAESSAEPKRCSFDVVAEENSEKLSTSSVDGLGDKSRPGRSAEDVDAGIHTFTPNAENKNIKGNKARNQGQDQHQPNGDVKKIEFPEESQLDWQQTNGDVNTAHASPHLSQHTAQHPVSSAHTDLDTRKQPGQQTFNDAATTQNGQELNSSAPGELPAPALFIDLDENDHVTGVIPLSPVTREHLERAVTLTESRGETDPDLLMSLQHDLSGHRHYQRHRDQGSQAPRSGHGRLYSGTSTLSRSSEDISSLPRTRLFRLTSVEYLDPPMKIFASHSSSNLRAPSLDSLKKSASNVSDSPQQRIRARLNKLHLPSMRRFKRPERQENNHL